MLESIDEAPQASGDRAAPLAANGDRAVPLAAIGAVAVLAAIVMCGLALSVLRGRTSSAELTDGMVFEAVVAEPFSVSCSGGLAQPLHVIDAGGHRWYERFEIGRFAPKPALEAGRSYEGDLTVISTAQLEASGSAQAELVTAAARVQFDLLPLEC